ncbi:MAG TPA: 1,2-phenylacetyl-CoA epoxidase subunit PaaE [Steroidobacter sp.]
MLSFHSLKVAEVRPEATDAICLAFEVPESLREAYRFKPGQHITLRAKVDGQELRRTYSICSASDEPLLRIGVRVQEKGAMSRYLARELRPGSELEVMMPTGRFFVEPDPSAARAYCAFAAGSGITPILGILKNVLKSEPASRFTLFYGNRSTSTIMFAEELLALKDLYTDRLALHFVLSREPQDIELLNGRLDADKVAQLAGQLFDPAAMDAYFLCGPGSMIDTVRQALLKLDVDPARIHSEHFLSEATPARTARAPEAAGAAAAPEKTTHVTVVMDGRRRSFTMPGEGRTVLEAAEEAGLDLPYSCRAGVCSTCRTRVVRGSVTMTTNYALEPWEVEAGYVLCCQALPTSSELEITYDER